MIQNSSLTVEQEQKKGGSKERGGIHEGKRIMHGTEWPTKCSGTGHT